VVRLVRFIPLVIVCLEACIDPLKIELLSGTQKFVVDGLITNDLGPYEVRLAYSTSLDNALRKTPTAKGATVWIYDTSGSSEKLNEVSPGVYQTSATGIRGIVGRSYYVKIKTQANREYQSVPQRMTPGGEIENVSFDFQLNGVKDNDPGEYRDALKIVLDSKGVIGEQNLFRWRWYTIFEALTFPELRVNWNGEPAPLPCSGYIPGGPFPNRYGITKVGECTCCICWPYNYSPSALISHNRVIDGIEFKKIDMGNIPAGPQEFYKKYFLRVEQLSVSQDVYDFWNLVEKQESANGNLFQPNSIKIHGNVRSLNDPDEEVLGIFGVSGIARKEIYISPNELPYPLPPLDSIKDGCDVSFQRLTTVKPSFW
jgi:hypothetical protein